MSWMSKLFLSNLRPFFMLKNISSMTTLSSPTATYSGIVHDTLTEVYEKYQHRNDIKFAKTACEAATFLDEYLTNTEETENTKNSAFLCHIYHLFVELIFNTLEIVENNQYTSSTHDLENIHYNIYTNTYFNKHCGSEQGPHGETSLFMISYIAQKVKFDYNITFEEFQRHAHHVDAHIEEIMTYLRAKHLNTDEKLNEKSLIDQTPPLI